jgi:hypothetical protein
MTMTRAGCIACLLGCCCGTSLAAIGRFDKYPHETVADPTRSYLPGKYYERVALEAMRHKDYTGALNACQRAAYSGRAGPATTEGDPDTYTFAIDGYDPSGDIQDAAELVSELNALGVQNGAVSLAGYWPARKKEFAKFVTTQFGHVEIGPLQQVAPAKSKPAR